MNIIFTVCNRNTLAGAQVLAETVIRYQPDSIMYLCWVDTCALPALPDTIQVIDVSDVRIPGFKEMCDRYYDFELVAACRPWFALHIFGNRSIEFDTLTFLAPSSMLVRGIVPMPQEFDLCLTPNITGPLPRDPRLDDKRILNVGMFYSGAWSVRKSEATEKMLQWWASRTFDRAKFDLCNGMCMDQLWLNYAPVWVPQTTMRSNPGWQFGLRSVLSNPLKVVNGIYYAGDEPLISLDFTGLITFDPVWSDHVGLLSENRAFEKLFKEYKKKVEAAKVEIVAGKMGGYGIFPKISEHRLLRKRVAALLYTAVGYIDRF